MMLNLTELRNSTAAQLQAESLLNDHLGVVFIRPLSSYHPHNSLIGPVYRQNH
jgi:hypothetical protein